MKDLMNTQPGIFVSAFGIGLSGAAMPGTVLAATISSATYWGFCAGPLVALCKRFITNPALQNMIRVCAVLLIGFGVYFAVSGVARLRRPATAESAPS